MEVLIPWNLNRVNQKESIVSRKRLFFTITTNADWKITILEILMKEYYPEVELIYTTDITKAFKNIDFVFAKSEPAVSKCANWTKNSPSQQCNRSETCGPGGLPTV